MCFAISEYGIIVSRPKKLISIKKCLCLWVDLTHSWETFLFFSPCVWSVLKDFHFKNWLHWLSPFLPRSSAIWNYIWWVREKTREFPSEQEGRRQNKHKDADGFLFGCTFNVKGWAWDTMRPRKDVTLQLKMTFDSLYIFFQCYYVCIRRRHFTVCVFFFSR